MPTRQIKSGQQFPNAALSTLNGCEDDFPPYLR